MRDARPSPRVAAPPVSPAASVAGELRRVEERWRVLPVDRATDCADGIRALVQRLADQVARQQGRRPSRVPDLGPATLMDQLGVVVHDAVGAGIDGGLAADLAELRRSLG